MTTLRLPKILILIVACIAINIRESGSDVPMSPLPQPSQVKPNTETIDNIKNESLTPSTSEKYDFNDMNKNATVKSVGANRKQPSFDVEGGVTCSKPEEASLGLVCSSDSEFSKGKNSYPKDCKEVLLNGNKASGVYVILPNNAKTPFPVLCDMEIKGGGWTHIQKRFDGSQDFSLGYKDYKFGFGNLYGEFWLGLEKIHLLSGFNSTELYVEIVDRGTVSAFAHYTSFEVGSEAGGYKLEKLSGFSGDAGDSLAYHLGSKFSTKDLDFTDKSCATKFLGAHWYKDCLDSNLNGKFINTDLPEKFNRQGLQWKTYRSENYIHAKSRMLVRPVH